MGYYTYFRLFFADRGTQPTLQDYNAIKKMIDESVLNTEFEPVTSIPGNGALIQGENLKWYDHRETMLTISKTFPLYEFYLEGEGEERDDIWIKHFKNGKMFVRGSEIIYDDAPSENWAD